MPETVVPDTVPLSAVTVPLLVKVTEYVVRSAEQFGVPTVKVGLGLIVRVTLVFVADLQIGSRICRLPPKVPAAVGMEVNVLEATCVRGVLNQLAVTPASTVHREGQE